MAERRVSRRRLGHRVRLVRVGEDDALAHQPVEPALQERSEPLQIVGRQLVDDEEQHQRRASRRRRLRGRGRGRLARGQPARQQGQHANGAKTHA